MSSFDQNSFRLQLSVYQQHSQLIAGLEDWLELELLSDSEITLTVKGNIDSPQLLSGLEAWLQRGLIDEATVKKIAKTSLNCSIPEPKITSISKEIEPSSLIKLPQRQNWLQQVWQSLQAEFSVQWLLFLGVFMVIVSSGVLVASQWKNFSPLGQYSVLFGYTLSFWGVSLFANRNGKLPLTARTLRMITLLLLPINFWAVNEFELGIFISILIALALTFILFRICQFYQRSSPLILAGCLELSFIHLAWDFSPLLIVYLSVISLIGFFIYCHGKYDLAIRLLFYSLGVIIFRALLVTRLPRSQLGLGLGMVIMTIFFARLIKHWRRFDLIAFLFSGLLSLISVWGLITPDLQRDIIDIITTFNQPYYSVFSLVFFPYLIFIIAFSDWLHKRQKNNLGVTGEVITIMGIIILIGISFPNPTLRTITLLNATISLSVMTWRWDNELNYPNYLNRSILIYLTHFIGLITLWSGLKLIFPSLSLEFLGVIAVAVTLIEWGFSFISKRQNNTILNNWRYTTIPPTPLAKGGEGGIYCNLTFLKWDKFLIFCKSAWYFGLGLAGLSYCLFWSSLSSLGLFWLFNPIALTFIATQTINQKNSANLSAVALFFIQPLMIAISLNIGTTIPIILSLGISSITMLINTVYIHSIFLSLITVGFGLALEIIFLDLINLEGTGWLISGGITIALLWLFHKRLYNQSSSLKRLYAKATDYWGIILAGILLLILTRHSFSVYWDLVSFSPIILMTEGILFAGISLRYFSSPSILAIYALGWNLEIILAEVVSLIDFSLINLAIVNLILGLAIQLFGDYWGKRNQITLSRHWHIIPLLYGSLGTALRWGTFTRWTGLLTLALALLLLGIGRRKDEFKPLLYLALVGISISAYETLFYQFSLFDEQAINNSFILMSALGITIIYGYRLLSTPIKFYLNFSEQELNWVTHCHWLGSVFFLVIASFYSRTETNFLGLATGILLLQYSLIQGRKASSLDWKEGWVYATFILGAGMYFYWVNLPLTDLWVDLFTSWQGAIFSAIAYFLYTLPWDNWGWSKRPWQKLALLLPIMVILTNPLTQNTINYLFLAAFYLVPTLLKQQVRYSYISLMILVVLSLKLGWDYNITYPLWYAFPVSGSILYFTQFDPLFRHGNHRSLRHLWRCFSVGMICLISFLSDLETGLIPGGISLIFILIGLGIKIRAFLYVGTITFLLNATYQLGILIFEDPISKWIIGLLVGCGLIWLAATFETRRENIRTFIENWVETLNRWE
ncbi:MAG: hypothetical protein ACLFTJ_08645 [Halothece sp.]